MTTLADKSLLSGGDNKPPMLEKHLYDSWKSRMELYMLNRHQGRMILASFEKGPLIWPSITKDGVTRLKEYIELTLAESIQADYLWEKIKLLMQGTSLTKQEREYAIGQFQVTPSFLNTLPGGKSKIVTDVKWNCSHALTEVLNPDNLTYDLFNQSEQIMTSSEQSNDVSQSETKITSDSNIIPYSQYLSEAQQETVQNSNSSAQQDVMILSIYKEEVKDLKEMQNVENSFSGSNEQYAEIVRLKQNLFEQVQEKDSFNDKESSESKPKLYDGNTILKMDTIVIPNSDETLMLCEESRSKLLLKEQDPMVVSKKEPLHSITEGTRGFEQTKACFRDEIISV
ncbi:hypothetical protein Tco_0727814 [Tanacetum coccineum]|uniref:Uncharacterized protein n=1 Tax=Tanacetum coccineum TaxID=301880 RepID=A0ABQ4YMH6_9ASTR